MTELSRRQFASLIGTAFAGSAVTLAGHGPAEGATTGARVVVVGGGFAGATCAKYLRRAGPNLQITLVEPNAAHTTCVFSNEVVVGLRKLASLNVGYTDLATRYGVTVRATSVVAVDPARRTVTLADGGSLSYDRLVMAPGIAFRFDAIPGYDEAAAALHPHAWIAGAQTTALAAHLKAQPTKAHVIVTIPPAPYRCPPAPYERAGLFAWWLSKNRPGSKVTILDANDTYPKQPLFEEAWAKLYPGVITRISGANGGAARRFDPATMTVVTDAGSFKGTLINIIPPQKAGPLAVATGLVDPATGWCPIDTKTFESTLVPKIHVIGDAAASGLPKSGTSANASAKVCAKAIVALLAGKVPGDPLFINTCYSRLAPNYAIAIAGVYTLVGGKPTPLPDAFGTSPVGAGAEYRKKESEDADAWYRAFVADTWKAPI